MNKQFTYFILLVICVVSRLITSVNFVEDPQSLAISLNVIHPELFHAFADVQSPLFCLLIKLLSFVTNNFSVSFSIVGGVATFILIYYVLKLLKVPLTSLEGGITVCLIFFNPLIWIAGNRYTPDLLTCAMVFASFYYLLADQDDPLTHVIGWLLAGLIGGFSLMYFPFLLPPLIYSAIKRKYLWLSILSLLLGISSWMLPSVFLYPERQVLEVLKINFFGDSFNTVHSFSKLSLLFKSIWAGGLGGYWWQRSLFTVLSSIALLPCLFFGTLILLSFNYPRSKILVILLACVTFLFGIYFSSASNNISILMLLPLLLVIIAYGMIYFLVNFNLLAIKAALLLFMVFNIWMGIYYAREHQNPNAVEQLRVHLLQRNQENCNIVAMVELCNFLNSQSNQYLCKAGQSLPNIVTTYQGKFAPVFTKESPKNTYYFTHNPFVNSKWSDLELREY